LIKDVNGWEQEYMDAVSRSKPQLPKLTQNIELGIKALAQRMKAGDQYPPEPVRSVEVALHEYLARLTKGTQFHYHGVIQFPLLNGELLDTQYVLTIMNGRLEINASQNVGIIYVPRRALSMSIYGMLKGINNK
jgi:hypothetical protein